MSNKRVYSAAVIGCGNIGAVAGNYNKAVQPGTHAGAYQQSSRIKLVALVDNQVEKHISLSKDFPGVNIFSDAGKMFEAEHPEIVSVAVPTDLHRDMVLLAAKYKVRAILCEKPISYSIKEAKEMIDVCKKNNVLLFINHQRHFDPILRKWAHKVKEGFLGEIFQVNSYYYNGLFNAGTHLIDLLCLFFGDPKSVMAKYNGRTSSNKTDLNADGLIFFNNGATVSLQSLNKNYGCFGFSIFGNKGWLNITNLGFEVEFRKKMKNRYFKGYYELSEKIFREGKPRSFMVGSVDTLVKVLDKKIRPDGTGEDGLKVVKILQTLKKSADNNGKEYFVNYG